jgi:hypothetical protein
VSPLRLQTILLVALLAVALPAAPAWARGKISFGSSGDNPDRMKFKARGVAATGLEPDIEGMGVALSNVTGTVFSESLEPGELVPNAARTRWRFSRQRDGGIYKGIVVKKLRTDGTPTYSVKVQLDADLGATDPVSVGIAADLLAPMVFTLSVGDDVLSSSAHWEPLRSGWRTRSDELATRYLGPSKRVFVTSACYLGSLEGVGGADAKCQSLADAAGLAGTFTAWLADAHDGPAVRLPHASVPYVLVDTSVIARDWSDLVDGEIWTPVGLDETGSAAANSGDCGVSVWTNTSTLGTPAISDALEFACYEWTLSLFSRWGLLGNAAETDARWTDGGALALQRCSSTARLYCFER